MCAEDILRKLQPEEITLLLDRGILRGNLIRERKAYEFYNACRQRMSARAAVVETELEFSMSSDVVWRIIRRYK